jgi:hypothetical protein
LNGTLTEKSDCGPAVSPVGAEPLAFVFVNDARRKADHVEGHCASAGTSCTGNRQASLLLLTILSAYLHECKIGRPPFDLYPISGYDVTVGTLHIQIVLTWLHMDFQSSFSWGIRQVMQISWYVFSLINGGD